MKTDKKKLKKGIQFMAITLILMFAGPVVVHSSFKNQDHFLYYPVLLIGIFICMAAVFLGFRGINTIVKALFNGK